MIYDNYVFIETMKHVFQRRRRAKFWNFFQNLLQAGGGEILTIVLYRANNVVL